MEKKLIFAARILNLEIGVAIRIKNEINVFGTVLMITNHLGSVVRAPSNTYKCSFSKKCTFNEKNVS